MKRRRFLRAFLTTAAGGLSLPTGVVAFVRSGGSSEAEKTIPAVAEIWIGEIDGTDRMHDFRSEIAEAFGVPVQLMTMHPESYHNLQKYYDN
jgi:hypothetical protein